MPAPVAGPSTISAVTAPAASPPASNPVSTASATPTTNSPATRSSKPTPKTTWQTFKNLLPSYGAVQILMGLFGLILAIVGIKWAARSYNMARWTELKDFRDDCRSVQATGVALSKACVEALGKELEPPPYAPIHFYRLAKRGFNATDAVEFVHLKAIEIWRGFKHFFEGVLRESSAALLGIGSSEDTKAVPRMAFQNWRWIASATELVALFRDINLGKLWLLITSSSQWTGQQVAEVPQYMGTLSTAFASWLRTLSIISQTKKLRELSSFLPHPWTFDFALLLFALLSTAQYFRHPIISGIQTTLFIGVLVVHYLILWLTWCSDCYGTLWRVITRIFPTICFVFILLQRIHTYREHLAEDPHNFPAKYALPGSGSMALMASIELFYEITLLHDVSFRSYFIFGIILRAAAFFTILLLEYYSILRRRALHNRFFHFFGVLFTHTSEICFFIYHGGILLLWEWLLVLLLYGILAMEIYRYLI
ncbi:hypothetical protein L207DRAFT_518948 [Hyaloscypha variabilis F]|uniref:Uncharacterized protein n=1 Tax=Hyaloscypha variabilis (strain UAMH 11265 / GT02V1 / F) TaxID=1149755 RepID=A0A2J6R0P3_HYAVF|nr:hypothetical protein L207DRAFT_518948 [Hyaloscypha variabilis F]